VAISDPATAHFTAHKNLGNTRTAYKPRYTHTHTHLETLEARGKNQVAISDTATHRPQHTIRHFPREAGGESELLLRSTKQYGFPSVYRE
jgi:hypothetical protein